MTQYRQQINAGEDFYRSLSEIAESLHWKKQDVFKRYKQALRSLRWAPHKYSKSRQQRVNEQRKKYRVATKKERRTKMTDSKDLVEMKTQLPVEDLGLGFEDMEGTDFSAPFLVICQSNSPYLNPTHQLYIEDAKQSMIINTQNMNCYSSVNVIPVKYAFKNVEWKPRNTGGGFVASYYRNKTPDDLSTDPITGRIIRKNGNEILPTAYYLCMLEEEGFDRVIIPMYSTQLKKSRKWNSMMVSIKQQGKSIPMFANSYVLSTVQESNNKGSWYGWKIDFGTYIPDLSIDIYNAAKELSQIDNFLPEKLLEAQSLAHKTNDDLPF